MNSPYHTSPVVPAAIAGEMLWLHAPHPSRVRILDQLARRICAQRPGLDVVITARPGIPPPARLQAGIYWGGHLSDTARQTREFLQEWSPKACLWAGFPVLPGVVSQASHQGVCLILSDATRKSEGNSLRNRMSMVTRSTLRWFSHVLAEDATEARAMRRLGARPERIRITGPMLESSPALPCNTEDLETLHSLIAGRPVWLAAMAQRAELEAILNAHRTARRFSHRLLLILLPNSRSEEPEFARIVARQGFQFARWSQGETPDEHCSVFLADCKDELGLWFRLAPVSFLANSLVSGGGGCDPFEAAGLGSAIIYGPNISDHIDRYTRLTQVAAARIANDADSLSRALIQLVQPHQAAGMAHAAWRVLTQNAEVTDLAIDLLQSCLDEAEVK